MTDSITSPSLVLRARRATTADRAFVSWCNMTASSPEPDACYWDMLIAHTGTSTPGFVEALFETGALAWGGVEDYWLIEHNGKAIAGGSGFEMSADDYRPLKVDRLPAVAARLGWSATALEQFQGIYGGVWPEPRDVTLAPQASWILECIAVAPEMRGRGVAGALLDALLAEGRRRGHAHAGISVTHGNTPAQRAYEKHGFQLYVH
jgi:ribosomal protein S18 acetylase RimI-like enzyme